MERSMAVNSVNNIAASSEGSYVSTTLNISNTNEETRNIMSSTFSLIKSDFVNALMNAVGFDPNVSIDFIKTQNDPNRCMVVDNKKFWELSAVGRIQTYDQDGHKTGGISSFQTMG